MGEGKKASLIIKVRVHEGSTKDDGQWKQLVKGNSPVFEKTAKIRASGTGGTTQATVESG